MRRLRLCLAVYAAAAFVLGDGPRKTDDLARLWALHQKKMTQRLRAIEPWPPALGEIYALPRCVAPGFSETVEAAGRTLRYTALSLPGRSCGWRSNGPALDAGEPFGVAVGDSFTDGAEVSDEATWTARLSALSGRRFLNLGAGGQGLTGHLERLRASGVLALKPRVVVLQLCFNDIIEDAWIAKAKEVRAGRGAWDMGRPPGPLLHALGPFLNYIFVIARLRTIGLPRPTPEQWAQFGRDLAAARSELEGGGARVLVIAEPPDFARRLARLYPDQRIFGVDVDEGRRVYFDWHWNERGHELVARRIHLELVKRGWLAQSAKRRS